MIFFFIIPVIISSQFGFDQDFGYDCTNSWSLHAFDANSLQLNVHNCGLKTNTRPTILKIRVLLPIRNLELYMYSYNDNLHTKLSLRIKFTGLSPNCKEQKDNIAT